MVREKKKHIEKIENMFLFFSLAVLIQVPFFKTLLSFFFCPLPIQFSLLSVPAICYHLLSSFLCGTCVTIQFLHSIPPSLPQANFPSWIQGPSVSSSHLGVSKQGPKLEAAKSEGYGQGLHTCFSSMLLGCKQPKGL